MADDRFYFKQLLSGRDFAKEDPMARQMVNFVYLIGDRETGEAVAVDPAYSPDDLIEILGEDDMQLTGVLATHYHPDHVGGSMAGFDIVGVSRLLELADVPIHIQAEEAEFVKKVTGITDDHLVSHGSGEKVTVGAFDIELIHTPGHTPGSQSFLVENMLVSGDTLFLEGCGRTDLPGSDPAEMYLSLTQRLSRVPDEAVLYPGHLYAPQPSAPMGEVRSNNYVFMPKTADQWMMMFGGQ